jgi:hypothetical protein
LNRDQAKQYLCASEAYINKQTSKIIFDFPKLPNSWIWKGYYTRNLNSAALQHFGKVAIRVAYDKTHDRHHAYLPLFIIPYIALTIFDINFLVTYFLKGLTVDEIIQYYSKDLREYYDLSTSSCYYYLKWFVIQARTALNYSFNNNSILNLKDLNSTNLFDQYLKYLMQYHPP